MHKPLFRLLPLLALVFSLSTSAAQDLELGPDSHRQEGVPQGKVTKHTWDKSGIYPGTVRDYWVYVPAQYKPGEPACVMVWQDGGGRVSENGQWRVPIVFDNLIHKGEIPVTIGIFINPGYIPAANENAEVRHNRSFEYDSMGDRYARFLLEEILPEVGKTYDLKQDGNSRAIAGASSGAICAFTAAWERPDEFSRVYSTIGTYVSLRGGHNYPWMIRKFEPKPLRIFLQDGSNDLDIYCGDWWMANQDMLSAFEFAGYDVKHVWTDGGHNGEHGGALTPDALRWLWRDYPAPVAKPQLKGSRGLDIYLPGEDWELVAEGFRFTEGPAVDAAGNLYFTDIPDDKIHKVTPQGAASVFAEDTGGANGLAFGPDGRLYACANRDRQIVVYNTEGEKEVLAKGVSSNDLVVNHAGDVWFTDPGNKQVWHLPKGGEPRVVDRGISRPNGITLTTDQTYLMVADTDGPFVYSFQVQPDGSLAHKQEYHILHIPVDKTSSGADGMAVDSENRLYVTTHFGIQVCDQLGRVHGIIRKPQPAWLSNVTFGGPNRDFLYVTCGDKVYKRKIKAKGVDPASAPVKPPRPRL